MYKNIDTSEDINDLLTHKEFYVLGDQRNKNSELNDELSKLIDQRLKIQSHQLFDALYMNPNTNFWRLHLLNSPGTGKCHARDTPIMMHDGRVKMVQDIIVGDKLMGDDSRARNVLSLARGREEMCRVVIEGYPEDSFVCNMSHVLSLKCTDSASPDYGCVIDISIKDYMEWNNFTNHHYKLYRAPVDFPDKPVCECPYKIGYSVGRSAVWIDGFTNNSSTNDSLTNYMFNSREKRLQLLAGVIDRCECGYDSDSYCKHYKHNTADSGYITHAYPVAIANKIVYIARSLGFTAQKVSAHDGSVKISGNVCEIPSRLYTNKLCLKKDNNSTNVSVALNFHLEKLPVDDYYGFTLDGNSRYLLGSFIVTHNTLAAINIASKFIKLYKNIYQNMAAKMQATKRNFYELDRGTPTVFVLGFGGTKSAFIRDLLKYPEFGYISPEEREEFVRRQHLAESGFTDDIQHYKEYYSMLKKRIITKSVGGFYKFYGYDEFVNRLFISGSVKLTELESITLRRIKEGEDITLEDVIKENIAAGNIGVDARMLEMFHNSLLICDELHNTYNMNMKNNRGVAIQYILDTIPDVRFLSMSATPINNSSTEVIEFANYLINGRSLSKKEFFQDPRNMYPGKLKELASLLSGKISFLQDINVKFYPTREFKGVELLLPYDFEHLRRGDAIPYLKFIPCVMSEFHQDTYTEFINRAEQDIDTEESLENWSGRVNTDGATADAATKGVPTDGYSIFDIAFPVPGSEVGAFKSGEVRNGLLNAPAQWRDEHKIYIKRFATTKASMVEQITGGFLLRNNIEKYSSKYAKILDILTDVIKSANGDPSKCQKVMIYHDRVRMSGVILLRELLLQNGYLDDISEPVDSTICCVCGKTLAKHRDLKNGVQGDVKNEASNDMQSNTHEYRPARVVIAHSDIDKTTMATTIDKFTGRDNSHGLNYMVLIGSKIIKESYDLKDIQHVIVVSLPVNIPTLIQVLGRSIRKNSHINLPIDQRHVSIYILISMSREESKYGKVDPISPEQKRYIEKILDYISIQNIERELNKNAIDVSVHRNTIMPPELLKQYFDNPAAVDMFAQGESLEDKLVPKNSLGNLYFDIKPLKILAPEELKRSTFHAYKYYEDEIATITIIIKRLFIIQPVWKYADLWERVKAPGMALEANPAYFDENNFIIALYYMCQGTLNITKLRETSNVVEKLLDSIDKFIYTGGKKYKIEHIGEYYISFPVVERAIRDVELYMRGGEEQHKLVEIDIDNYVRENRQKLNFDHLRSGFIEKYGDVGKTDKTGDLIQMIENYSADFQSAMIEESIIAMWDSVVSTSVVGVKDKNSKKLTIHNSIIDLYNKLGAIIYAGEVRRYKDVMKQYGELPGKIKDDHPIGYMVTKSIRLYSGEWFEINKLSLNRQNIFKENNVIVGMLESADDHMRFKLRRPIQKIQEDKYSDTRHIERGIVCSTKTKSDLVDILSHLGMPTSSLQKSDVRIKKLCELIKGKLIEKEISERTKGSRFKYLYSWWDEEVNLQAN